MSRDRKNEKNRPLYLKSAHQELVLHVEIVGVIAIAFEWLVNYNKSLVVLDVLPPSISMSLWKIIKMCAMDY